MKVRMIQLISISLFLAFAQAHAASASEATILVNNETQSINTSITEENKKAGEDFLAKNKTQSGVVTLPSGLQYKVIDKGKGVKPTLNNTVTVDYEGKLIDGKVFDSSYQRGTPATFPVSGVIQGWQEALPLMSKGATWMLYVPSELAYGQEGAGGVIGPNQVLIFKVHLIDVK